VRPLLPKQLRVCVRVYISPPPLCAAGARAAAQGARTPQSPRGSVSQSQLAGARLARQNTHDYIDDDMHCEQHFALETPTLP
jgi:uncharacterized MAPEG superfamily protein